MINIDAKNKTLYEPVSMKYNKIPKMADIDHKIFNDNKLLKLSNPLFLTKNDTPPIPIKAAPTNLGAKVFTIFNPKNKNVSLGKKISGIAKIISTIKCTKNHVLRGWETSFFIILY